MQTARNWQTHVFALGVNEWGRSRTRCREAGAGGHFQQSPFWYTSTAYVRTWHRIAALVLDIAQQQSLVQYRTADGSAP
eukprot:3083374-Rhodomonas_salina.3